MRIKRYIVIAILGFIFGSPTPQTAEPAQKANPPLRELHVIITDKSETTLDDLTKEDLHLTQDGVPQTIESFSLADLPVRYALVIDTSGSLRTQFPRIIETTKSIVAANHPDDEAFIVRFVDSNRIDVVRDITTDKDQLLTALGTLRVEGGRTALIDAIYVSAGKLMTASADRNVKGRKAMVLITDGEDRASLFSEDQLFKMLKKVNFKIFVIGLIQELDPQGGFIRKAPLERARQLIERLTKETGGRAFFPKKAGDFPKVVAEVTHDLHKQYVIRYRRLPGPAKEFYDVEIKVSDSSNKKRRKAILKPKYNAAELEGDGAQ